MRLMAFHSSNMHTGIKWIKQYISVWIWNKNLTIQKLTSRKIAIWVIQRNPVSGSQFLRMSILLSACLVSSEYAVLLLVSTANAINHLGLQHQDCKSVFFPGGYRSHECCQTFLLDSGFVCVYLMHIWNIPLLPLLRLSLSIGCFFESLFCSFW